MRLFTCGLSLALLSFCLLGLSGCGEDNQSEINQQASKTSGTKVELKDTPTAGPAGIRRAVKRAARRILRSRLSGRRGDLRFKASSMNDLAGIGAVFCCPDYRGSQFRLPMIWLFPRKFGRFMVAFSVHRA